MPSPSAMAAYTEDDEPARRDSLTNSPVSAGACRRDRPGAIEGYGGVGEARSPLQGHPGAPRLRSVLGRTPCTPPIRVGTTTTSACPNAADVRRSFAGLTTTPAGTSRSALVRM